MKDKSLKDRLLEDSWCPISKRIFFACDNNFNPSILFSLLIERHDFLVKKEIIKTGEWFLYPKEDICSLINVSSTWVDSAIKPLVEKDLVQKRFIQGKRIMYKINIEKFKVIL